MGLKMMMAHAGARILVVLSPHIIQQDIGVNGGPVTLGDEAPCKSAIKERLLANYGRGLASQIQLLNAAD